MQNKKFNDICALLESNPALSGVKSLDTANPKAAKQRYYSHNMVGEVVKQWALQPAPAPVSLPVLEIE